jgi:D-aminopeptidase
MTTARARLRELGITIGRYPTGPVNAITDVPGVLVGHKTIIRDAPNVVRTGVTVVVPREGRIHEDYPFAGFFSFNGIGEMTGVPLIDEWGVLTSPVVLTNTSQVGTARDALVEYGTRAYGDFAFKLPVVAETYDGFLSDSDAFAITREDVIEAVECAASGPVAEGSVGGGTGMICHEFKGGIGTASRLVKSAGHTYTLGALVQANHGIRSLLRVDGVPVGQYIDSERVPLPSSTGDRHPLSAPIEASSILIILATDAPLVPLQCKRLARRATLGMARAGGVGHNTSGDLFLAFATGNHYHEHGKEIWNIQMLPNSAMDPFFEASAEVVEEAILNALTCAETVTGLHGRTAYALPLDDLVEIYQRFNRVKSSEAPE